MSEERETPVGSPAQQTPAEASASDPRTPAAGEAARGVEPEPPLAGAPVEEAEATPTEVLAALDRAGELPADPVAPADPAVSTAGAAAVPAVSAEAPDPEPLDGAEPALADAGAAPERPEIVVAEELPSAGPTVVVPAAPAAPEGQLLISADHPMAALYMQTPMPPDLRGNRGAGVLISLLATVGFAIVYAGVLALWRAPFFPPSTFLDQGLLPWILSWGFLAACVSFLVGMIILVLIFGRAGWWVYIFGGVLVGLFVWGVSVVGYAYTAHTLGTDVTLTPLALLTDFGLQFPVIAAAIVAREASMWFGAWIGARGRRVTRRNAEALAEYEESLAEVQAKQP